MNIKTQAVSLYCPSWFETQCFREYPFQNFNTGFWWNSIQTYSRVDQSVCGKQNRSIRSMSEKAMLSHEAGIWNFHYKIGSIRNLGDEAGGCSSVYLVKFRGTGLFISKVSDEAWGFSFYGIRKSDQMSKFCWPCNEYFNLMMILRSEGAIQNKIGTFFK